MEKNKVDSKEYAFLVDNEVFHLVKIFSNIPGYDRHAKTLSSNPIFIDITGMPGYLSVKEDWIWDGKKFYDPKNPKIENEDSTVYPDFVKIIGVVDSIVQVTLGFNPQTQQIDIAGFKSNPKIVEITDLSTKPKVGWILQGNDFIEVL